VSVAAWRSWLPGAGRSEGGGPGRTIGAWWYLPIVAVGVATALRGVAVGALVVAALVGAGVVGLGLGVRRVWCAVSFGVVAGLMVLNYGFNNIGVPTPAGPVPVAEVALILLLLLVPRAVWEQVWGTWLGLLLALLVALAAIRSAFDFGSWGSIAVRDALYAFDALFLLVGLGVGRLFELRKVLRWLTAVVVVTLAYYSLYPLRETLVADGPQVGIQRPTPLLGSFSSGAVIAAAPFLFLVARRRVHLAAVLGSVAALAILGVIQERGVYLGLLFAMLVVWEATRTARTRSRIPPRVALIPLIGVLGLCLLALLPPLPGRVGPVRPSFVIAQLGTVVGGEGPSASVATAEVRRQWWSDIWSDTVSSPTRLLVGVGYGKDLISFKEGGEVPVRKPHNDYLEVFARTGIPGFLVWFGLLTNVLFGLRARVRTAVRTGDADRARLVAWALALAVCSMVVSFFQPLMSFAYGSAVLFFVVGLGLSQPERLPSASAAAEADGLPVTSPDRPTRLTGRPSRSRAGTRPPPRSG
jgi:O-antigen ligase